VKKIVHLDLETRSGADLTQVGAQRYAISPNFEILMASIGSEDRSAMWINPALGDTSENALAEQLLAEADEIYAHNAPFELACLWGASEQGKAAPAKPRIEAMRCTAAMARKAGLPYSLAKLAQALSLEQQKDTRGKALIKLFSIPQKDGTFVRPADFPKEFQEFQEYCRIDREVEQQIHAKLKPFELSGAALATFQFDLRMNLRGIPINVEAAQKAQTIIDEVQLSVLDEFQQLTGLAPTQREKIRELVGLSDMQAETVAAAIQSETDPTKRRILELYGKLSYAAVKKIQTMLDCVCPDNRVRGAHMYYGAGTGRWSGQLLQPQNFKKTSTDFRPLTDLAYRDIASGLPAKTIEAIYGDPLEVISYCIRHFIHLPGFTMLDADYAAVEARIVCWLAGQEDALAEYRAGVDRYQIMAAEIYRRPLPEIKALGKDSDERQLGKMAILGCFAWDTPVLTLAGLKPIGKIGSGDWLWDGIDWVQSKGIIYQGCQKTIRLEGVDITPDHLVLCGQTWNRAHDLVQNESTRLLALGNALESLQSQALRLENAGAFNSTEPSVLAAQENMRSLLKPFTKGHPRGASDVARLLIPKRGNGIGAMQTLCPTTHSGRGYSIGYPHAFHDAIADLIPRTNITAGEVFTFGQFGEKTAGNFYATLSPLKVTRMQSWNSIGKTWTGDMNRVICGSFQEAKMCATADLSQNSSKLSTTCVPVYDVRNAGPRNRFTIWTNRGPLIVHNCGFGMGASKFKASCQVMAGIEITEELAQQAIDAFRRKHEKVVRYWYQMDEACQNAVKRPGSAFGPFMVRTVAGIPFLLLRLRSGRSLAYPRPLIEPETYLTKDGQSRQREGVTYWGQLPGTVNWGRVKLYGGKIVENEVQATAADFMAHGAITAEQRGMEPFMLVHDQALAIQRGGRTPADFEAALGDLPPWAAGMPLKVEAKSCPYYRK
jgi:hypothetical protein